MNPANMATALGQIAMYANAKRMKINCMKNGKIGGERVTETRADKLIF